MLEDELQEAAVDVRAKMDKVDVPVLPVNDLQSRGAPGSRLVLIAASLLVFIGGGLLISNRLTNNEPSPTTPVTEAPDPTEVERVDEIPDPRTVVPVPGPREGLVTDSVHRMASELPRPIPGSGSVVEPQFGTPISAVGSRAAVSGESVLVVPGGTAAWNADGTRLILYERTEQSSGHALYDGVTLERIRSLDLNPPDIEELYWDPADPNNLYFISAETQALTSYDVADDRLTTVHSFDGCESVRSRFVARPISNDGTRFGFLCETTTGSSFVAYDLNTGAEVRGSAADGDIGPIPMPLGDGYVIASDDGVVTVLDRNLAPTGLTIAADTNAFLLTSTVDGRDLYVTTMYNGDPEVLGTVVAFDLADGSAIVGPGQSTGFPYPPAGTRLAAPAVDNGLVVATVVGVTDVSEQDTLDGEILVVDFNSDEPITYRLGRHRSTTAGGQIDAYWSSPWSAIDPPGGRVLFSSDWGQDRVSPFVVEVTTGN